MATASSGITAVVEDGVGGVLVAPGDVEAMADAVARLVGDAGARRAMGARALRHAARFDWAASGEVMLQSYHRHARPVAPRLEHEEGATRRQSPPPPPPPPLPASCAEDDEAALSRPPNLTAHRGSSES